MSFRIVATTGQEAVLEVVERLRRGAVVVASTDTNYGVFCNGATVSAGRRQGVGCVYVRVDGMETPRSSKVRR